ncbi:MAG: DUF4037 domain-containing protein [Dehalococcoidia bacterium]
MNESALLPNASPASIERYRAARSLADGCPPELGREIALTGSASRGLADDDSDIEVIFWVDAIPAPDRRAGWLKEAGATDQGEPHTTADGTIWEWSRYRGFWLETGWQSIDQHQEALQAILEDGLTDHRALTLADAVVRAVPLRTAGMLARWQHELAEYPDALEGALIHAASRRWAYALAYWALVRRNDRVAATERLLADVQSILRIVFALNRVWEPAWKWTPSATRSLAIKPERLSERIDQILALGDLDVSARLCAELAADTLALVPGHIDVSAARAAIDRSLRERAP